MAVEPTIDFMTYAFEEQLEIVNFAQEMAEFDTGIVQPSLSMQSFLPQH